MENEIYDTVIIGSGPAGLSAAIYNIRAALKTIVIGGNLPGGLLTTTTVVENYPGFPTGVGGTKLMMDMMQQVRNLGVEIRMGIVKKLRITNYELRIFEAELEDGTILKTKAIIAATGAKPRWLGVPGEKELIGKGVSVCATCDGAFFRGKLVAVIGGGNACCQEAEFLSKIASKVYLIHRRDSLRADAVEIEKIMKNENVEVLWNTEVIELNSKNQSPSTPNKSQDPMTNDQTKKLENIKIKNNKTGEEKMLEVEGMFVAIGRDPATEFLEGVVELKENKVIVTKKDPKFETMTTMPGIFAAGDCAEDFYRQAIVAAGEGARAALEAERWLEKEST